MFLLGVFAEEGDGGSGRCARTLTVRYAGVLRRSGCFFCAEDVHQSSGSPGELEVRRLSGAWSRDCPELDPEGRRRRPEFAGRLHSSLFPLAPQRRRRRLVLPRAAFLTSAIALYVFCYARLTTASPVCLERTCATRNPGMVYRLSNERRTCATL